jgi:hypothetical protein
MGHNEDRKVQSDLETDEQRPVTQTPNLMKQNSGFSYVGEIDHAKLLRLMPGAYLANVPVACFIICFLHY